MAQTIPELPELWPGSAGLMAWNFWNSQQAGGHGKATGRNYRNYTPEHGYIEMMRMMMIYTDDETDAQNMDI